MGSNCAELLDRLLAASPSPALRVAADGKVAFRNRAFEEQLGPAAEQAAMQAVGQPSIQLDGRRFDVTVAEAADDGFAVFFHEQQTTVSAGDDVEKRRGFFSIASHDLRGMLANVRSWASILTSGRVQLDDRGKRAAEVISRNTDKAIALMQEFFDSARADLFPVPVEIQPEDLRGELEKALATVEKEDPEQPVHVQLSCDADVSKVPVDLDRFRHILRAFLEHARARAGAGGDVQLTVHPTDEGIWFHVQDHGPKPSEAELNHAFDRDLRAVTERKLGAGFRLAFAAAEVAAHQGKVDAKARPDGASYGFWLPTAPGGRDGVDQAQPVASQPH
ncbi:MAG: ATP-binding protein [Myxococcaceae bacterium]